VVRKSAGFTLIEPIFAIVIISITVISLPVMNQVLAKGMEGNLVQEAVFAAATELNEALTAHWDDNSLEIGDKDGVARVIDISSICENNSSLPTYRQMPGHINQALHRRCLNSSTRGIAVVNDTNVTSLDDMAGTRTVFINNTINKQAGYKTDYNATITVTTSPIFNGLANPNMKRITVNVMDGVVPITSLTTYSANIGEVDYYKKEY